MDSYERMYACYNDLPFTWLHKAPYEAVQWDDRRVYELGLVRWNYGTSKLVWIMMNFMWFLVVVLFVDLNYIVLYLPIFNRLPEHLDSTYGKEWSKKVYGAEVWAADGKFLRPFFHLTPPMYTMTVEEMDG
eukprot:CAMPEP_0201489934 /NCGR_PEP_ID=MMETSP0151_2-20130828/24268_1 /ASSEMBLY_ACC=CAM_ASM_000257 /TAXON_ID=200890 /ORGANISM="Paramoeba atlantica, Strain 621/1 / CCAP 1560/9" /LENGTH=130 /DNA_ID=CAMNT_0047875681 /DNA_START=175 /DNA_END=567 /DNA_ORIENTATION=-